MSDLVLLTRDNDIAVITVNNPPVNALSPGVPEGIAEAVEQMGQDLDGLVIVAGAVEPRGVVQRVGEHGYAASSKSGRPGSLSRSSSAYSLRWSASMSETTSSARIECSCEPLSSPSRSMAMSSSRRAPLGQ